LAAKDDSIIGKMVNSDGSYGFLNHLEQETGLPLRKIGAYVSDEVSEFMTGDKRFSALPSNIQSLPEANPFGGQSFTGDFQKDLKISYGLLFGQSDEDKIGVITGNDPDATFSYYNKAGELLPDGSQTDGSETIIVNSSIGQSYILNRPGVSGADGADLLGEAVAYAPAGKAFSGVYQGYKKLGMATRNSGKLGFGKSAAVAGGLTYGTEVGIDAGMQALGSDKPIDHQDAAFNAALMAAFPLAGGAGQGMYRKAGEYIDPIKKALGPAFDALNTPVVGGSGSASLKGGFKK
jgi:hypothetical protein